MQFVFFEQRTAYEWRISDWSSDVCSSDLFRRQSIEEHEQVQFSQQFGASEVISRKDILSPYQDEILYFRTLRYADGRGVGGFAEIGRASCRERVGQYE